jgi:hypothetical protein
VKSGAPLIAGESVPFHAKFKENNILSNTPHIFKFVIVLLAVKVSNDFYNV